MRVLTFVGLVLFLLAQPAVSQAPDDKLVVPGQRIGKWTLEMTIDDLIRVTGVRNVGSNMRSPRPVINALEYSVRVYGQPTGSGGAQGTADWTKDVWFHFWDRQLLYAGTLGESSQQVVFLGIYAAPDFRTVQGVTMGTSRQGVEAAYGKPTVTTERRLIYEPIGLATRMRADSITDILVFRPGTAKSIWTYDR